MEDISVYYDKIAVLAMAYIPKILLALVVLIIGLWVVKKITKVSEKAMAKKEVDASLMNFLVSFISITLKLLLILSVISILGVQTTSFVAVLASAGFAVGMALQGSLGNFAGGVLILIFRPFKVGDMIDTQGFVGTVQSIQIFNTVLLTTDNKRILLPNGPVSNNPITNFTAEDTRRLDMSFGIGYEDNIDKAKSLINKVLVSDERVLKDPVPFIAVGELADSSVNFTVRVWCKTGDYWGIYFDAHENIKKVFDENSVSIPYPQTDVHLYNS